MLNLIGVLVAFIVIIFLIRKKINFGLSLIVGSLIVGVFSLQEIQIIGIPKAIVQASIYNFETSKIDTYTVELALLMTIIFILAKLMQETGAITKLIDSFRPIFSKGGTLGVIPALYGLMPVPGGALFSAPSIEEEGNKFKIKPVHKNFLNVWFRHIWFPIYPISSAMILLCSSQFADIENIYSLVLVNFPAFFASIIIGIFYLKKFVNTPLVKEKIKWDYYGFVFLLPPMIPLIFYWVVTTIFDIDMVRAFLIGMILSIIVLYFITKNTFKDYLEKVKKSITYKLALAIFGIMIFRQMIEVSKAPEIIGDIIGTLPFPSVVIIILIPLILGLVTGYNLGAVVLSYPLVEPFFASSGLSIIGFASIIFISSVVGYVISPIHLCNILSCDYLKTDTTRMYRYYIPAGLFMLLVQSIFIILFF